MESFTIEQRRAVATRHIDACADTLTHPEVKKALGAYADRLLQILDWLYVPNMREGVYEAPRRFRDSPRIPLIIMAPDEEAVYRTDNLVPMHPEQRANLETALKRTDLYETDNVSLDIDSAIDEITRSAKIREGGCIGVLQKSYLDNAVGYVHAPHGRLHEQGTDNSHIWVANRPMVVLNAVASLEEGMTLAHENTHVDQFFDETLVYDPRDNKRTQVELLPNHIEYTALMAKYGGRLPDSYWNIERIEKVRRLANGDGENAFKATPRLLKLMARRGFDASFGHAPRQPAKTSVSTVSKKKNKHGRVGVKHCK